MNVLHISKSKGLQNLNFFQATGKSITIMVKANAYGHGMKEIASVLKNQNVKLGVATIDEAIALRKFWKKEILIVEPVSDFSKIEDFQFTIDSFEGLKKVINLGLGNNCYIKRNIGMNRFGICYHNKKLFKKLAKMTKKVKISGLLAHFSSLSCKDQTQKEYENFLKVKKYFNGKDLSISFGGSDCFKEDFNFDELRVGIGFYGYDNKNVKPIMRLQSQILKIFILKKGERLGYDGEYVAKKNVKIGVVGIGYGDGIDRKMTGFKIKVKDKFCEIVGKICMDCLFVDISNVNAKVGEFLTIFDNAEDVSAYVKTIPYEVLTSCTCTRCERKIER